MSEMMQESARSSVGLTRNAKGETQIAVKCYSGDEGIADVDAAKAKAVELYDALRLEYPL